MKNVAVSVRARLLNYSKQSQTPYQNLLDEFALGPLPLATEPEPIPQ